MPGRAPLVIATLVCVIFGFAVGIPLGSWLGQPSYIRSASPRERTWMTYAATERLILQRGSGAASESVHATNKACFQDLVSVGDLVTFTYPFLDQVFLDRFGAFLAERGIREYRYGPGLDGGQWPGGTITVHRNDAPYVRRFLEANTPRTTDDPSAK